MKIVLKNFYKHELSLWEKKTILRKANNYIWGILHHLTAKFHLQTYFVMHSNCGFPLFQKPKTLTKMKILEEKYSSHPRFPRNLRHNVFLYFKNFHFIVFFCFLVWRHNLVTSAVFQLSWFLSTSFKPNCPFF